MAGVSLGPGPELEYSRGKDSRPQRGSRDGWRVVLLMGGWATGGETAASGGDCIGSSGGILPPCTPNADPLEPDANNALDEGGNDWEGRRGWDICLTREAGELTVMEGGDGGGSLLVTPPLLDSVSSVASWHC